MLTPEEIEKRFGFHKAAIEGPNSQAEKHAKLRVYFKEYATWLDQKLPDGRNKSLALTALEECSMWAHKALANDQKEF